MSNRNGREPTHEELLDEYADALIAAGDDGERVDRLPHTPTAWDEDSIAATFAMWSR